MRLPLVVLAVPALALSGCGQLGSVSVPPVEVAVPAGAVLFEPRDLEVRVGRPETLTMRLTYRGFERATLDWSAGAGDVSITDLSCDPTASCTVEQASASGPAVVRLHQAKAISMRLSGLAPGQKRIAASLFAPGGCEPGVVDVCYAGTTVSQSATVDIRP